MNAPDLPTAADLAEAIIAHREALEVLADGDGSVTWADVAKADHEMNCLAARVLGCPEPPLPAWLARREREAAV
jgi:hypothetical protein